MASTHLLVDPLYRLHLTGEGHPERPERYQAVTEALEKSAAKSLPRLSHRAATDDEVAACHTREYIQTVKREVAGLKLELRDLSTGDTVVGPRSLEVALHAAGGVLNAVDAVVEGKARNAFCAVRPPGHHATPNRGMGFCLFNNVAIAARYAQRKHGLDRVLIVDWDVHHGNGTQDIFYSDGTVMFFSTHQSPWYPGTGHPDETGEGKGKGRIVNCPFPAGAGGTEILGSFRQKLMPAARAFQPDLVIVSAGFDSRLGDPLGRFRLTDNDFADLTRILMEIAELSAKGRLVSVLEGGYSLSGLAAGVEAHVRALAESDPPTAVQRAR
jgi:acetoin utilization deacetylase AcuC-like enzyme